MNWLRRFCRKYGVWIGSLRHYPDKKESDKCTSTNYEARFTGITPGSAGSSRDHGILTVEKAGSPKLSGDKKTYDYAKEAVNERINIADMLPDVRDPDPEDKPADDTKTQPDDKNNKSQDDADKKPMDTNKDYDGSDKRQNDTDKSQKSVKDSKVSDETEKDLRRDTSGAVTDTESSDMDNEGENNIESAQETMADDDQSMSETNSDRDNGVRGYILFGSIAFAIMLLVAGGLLFMVKKRRKE